MSESLAKVAFVVCLALISLFVASLIVWGWLAVFGVIEMP